MAAKNLSQEKRDSGLALLGKLPWGSHFCQFFQTQNDLTDILVPYFKAGLGSNEFCIWVTSEFFTKEEAAAAMEKAVPDFSKYLERGQMEIFPYTEWYLKTGKFEMERVLSMWLEKHNEGLAKGFAGLRVSGNHFWIDNKKDWEDFSEYESHITQAISNYKLLVLCTYSLDKCGANEIIDVVVNHQFALIKQAGEWQLIESDEHKITKEKLKESEQRFRNFITILGHELRNLLSPSVLSLDLIKDKKIKDKEIEKTIEVSRHQTDNLSRLLKDLLDASCMSEGRIELQKKEFDLRSAVKKAAEAMKYLLKNNRQKLEISVGREKIKIIADPLRIEQILVNLLSNASKYSEEKGVIKLNLARKENEALVKVKDFGMGIASSQIQNLFSLFNQLDQAVTKKTDGFGVGLYLARELSRMHGGDILAASEGLGKGSEFTVRLPLKKES